MKTNFVICIAVSVSQTSYAWPPEGTQCKNGPCGPGNDICLVGTPTKFVYHLSDIACDINDPNGPFYDPVHKMYHNFYQDHLAEPSPVGLKAGAGPDWGHWVSRDFLHWARLPVAIWNDKWYDNVAIYTGSATIIDGKPVIVYPGKCTGNGSTPEGDACSTGFTYDIAFPDNYSDPLYTNWTKPSYNPILNKTGDDPSTAWLTSSGEWRMIGNQQCTDDDQGSEAGAPIYGSMDFKTWYKVGCTTLLLGDCPTFFPLPPLVSETADWNESMMSQLPTHVHKAGSSNDQVQVGIWTDGKPGPVAQGGTPGTWIQQGNSIPLDNGATHASKDFYDPVKNRRIMWVWATIKGGAQTVPREMNYDPRIGRIVYNPVEEIMDLRSKIPIGVLTETTLTSISDPVVLKGGHAIDVEIIWQLPTVATSLQTVAGDFIALMEYIPHSSTMMVSCGTKHDIVPMLSTDTNITLRLLLDTAIGEAYFQKGRVAMTWGGEINGDIELSVHNITALPPSHAYEYMPDYDLGGGDYKINNTFGWNNTDPKTCESLCEADPAMEY